jgi:hypothetical protein
MQNQTQIQIDAKAEKAAAAKAAKAAKAAAAAKAKAGTDSAFYVALMVAVLAGKMGAKCAAYYTRANAYHAKQGTSFPRPRTEGERALMTKEKAQAVIAKAQAGTLAAGSMEGQALFDLMRANA